MKKEGEELDRSISGMDMELFKKELMERIYYVLAPVVGLVDLNTDGSEVDVENQKRILPDDLDRELNDPGLLP